MKVFKLSVTIIAGLDKKAKLAVRMLDQLGINRSEKTIP